MNESMEYEFEAIKSMNPKLFKYIKSQIELDLLNRVYHANNELKTFENILNEIESVSKQVPKKDKF